MKTYNGKFLRRAELEALGVICEGDDVSVHTSVVIINPEGLHLGNHVRIDPFCVLSATGGIKLGNYIHISSHCILIGGGGIELEDFCTLSHGVKIFSVADDTSGEYLVNPTVPDRVRRVRQAPVKIKRHAGVGAGAILLPGVTIGEGAAVGALTLVRKDVSDWTVWFGVPARYLRRRRKGLLALESRLMCGATGGDQSLSTDLTES